MAYTYATLNLDKAIINAPQDIPSKPSKNQQDTPAEFDDYLRKSLEGFPSNQEKRLEKPKAGEDDSLNAAASETEGEELLTAGYAMPDQAAFIFPIQGLGNLASVNLNLAADQEVIQIGVQATSASGQQPVLVVTENPAAEVPAPQPFFNSLPAEAHTFKQDIILAEGSDIIPTVGEPTTAEKTVTASLTAATAAENQAVVVKPWFLLVSSPESQTIPADAGDVLNSQDVRTDGLPDQKPRLDLFEITVRQTTAGDPEQPGAEDLNRFKAQDSLTDVDAFNNNHTDGQGVLASVNNLADKGTAEARLEPIRVIEQIVQQMDMNVQPDSSEITIKLKPEHLGKMLIHLSWEEGKLTARFITESQEVKNLLDTNLIILKQNLEANGIKVEKAEISYQLTEQESFSQHFTGSGQQGSQQGSNRYPWGRERVAGEEEDAYLVNWADNLEEDATVNQETQLDYLI